jgi:hypothetical protein
MVISTGLRIKSTSTADAGKSRLPMIQRVHMLARGSLCRELAGTCFTFKRWGPVIKGIHVLVRRMLTIELSITALAFNYKSHMVIFLGTIGCRYDNQ